MKFFAHPPKIIFLCLYKLISIAKKVCTPFPPYWKNDDISS